MPSGQRGGIGQKADPPLDCRSGLGGKPPARETGRAEERSQTGSSPGAPNGPTAERQATRELGKVDGRNRRSPAEVREDDLPELELRRLHLEGERPRLTKDANPKDDGVVRSGWGLVRVKDQAKKPDNLQED